jgi:hypothetical protein
MFLCTKKTHHGEVVRLCFFWWCYYLLKQSNAMSTEISISTIIFFWLFYIYGRIWQLVGGGGGGISNETISSQPFISAWVSRACFA